MIKIGLKLWSDDSNMISEAIKLYQEGYFDYIELYIVPKTYEDYIRTWCDLKIPFLIHCTHSMHGFNLADREKFDDNLKIFSEVKKFADDLCAKYIVFHPGMEGSIKESVRQITLLRDSRFLVENKPYMSMSGRICRGSTYEELQEIISSCNVSFCLDIAHAINASFHLKKDLLDNINEMLSLGPEVIHISDGEIKEKHDSHLNIGYGNFDFRKIFKNIPLVKGSYWTIETDRRGRGLDYFIKDVEKIKEFVLSDKQYENKQK